MNLVDEEGNGDADDDHADEQVETKNIYAITLLVGPAHCDDDTNNGHNPCTLHIVMTMITDIMKKIPTMQQCNGHNHGIYGDDDDDDDDDDIDEDDSVTFLGRCCQQ